MKRAAILFLLFLLPNILAAQDPLEKELANSLESFETESDENSLLQLADDMELLKSQKININRASMRDLERIPQLDIFQIHNLLEYRRKILNTAKMKCSFDINTPYNKGKDLKTQKMDI